MSTREVYLKRAVGLLYWEVVVTTNPPLSREFRVTRQYDIQRTCQVSSVLPFV